MCGDFMKNKENYYKRDGVVRMKLMKKAMLLIDRMALVKDEEEILKTLDSVFKPNEAEWELLKNYMKKGKM
jgi:hypothetical protein